MRNSELAEGIDVIDKDGNVIGTSKVAAKKVKRSLVIYLIIIISFRKRLC